MGMFPSRPEAWRKGRAFIETFCKDAGLPRDSTLKANLVVEELFLNTVKHGHRGGSDAPVWITMEAADGSVSLTYEDRAPRARSARGAARAPPRRRPGRDPRARPHRHRRLRVPLRPQPHPSHAARQ